MCVLLLLAVVLPAPAMADGPATATAPAAPRFRWKRIDAITAAQHVFTSPVDPNTVFVWTVKGLLVSEDGGETFAPRGQNLKDQLGTLTALLVHPITPEIIYAGTAEKGIFVSLDAARTFQPVGGLDKGLTHLRIHSLAFAPNDASFTTIYATHSLDNPGMSMTIDGGKTWRKFGEEYAAADIAITEHGIYFAGKSNAQGAGFYRFDPSRSWFCMLLENPTVLLTSRWKSETARLAGIKPEEFDTIWMGTETGLRATEDSGITLRKPPPGPRANIVSLASGIDSLAGEILYAYDPTGEGVLRSTNGFATWDKLNSGLQPTEWIKEGAHLVANAGGSVLYACRNGDVYRGAEPIGPLRFSAMRVEPAALVPADRGITLTCRALPGATIAVDCTALGAGVVSLHEEAAAPGSLAADRVYSATIPPFPTPMLHEKDNREKPLVGPVVLPVQASLEGKSESHLALLTLLPRIADTLLWNGEEPGNVGLWGGRSLSLSLSGEEPHAGKQHLRINVTGADEGTFAFKNGDAVDAWSHKMLSFYIRATTEGQPDLFVSLKDYGGGTYQWQATQRSHEIDLSKYLPKLTTQYQFVTIPMVDFVFGSAISPRGIRALVFRSAGTRRTYDVDDIVLLAKPAPNLTSPAMDVLPDGKTVQLRVAAATRFGAVKSVAFRLPDGSTVPLTEVPPPAGHKEPTGQYAATVPLTRFTPGTQSVAVVASDDQGTTTLPTDVFLPAHPPGIAARADTIPSLDGSLLAFADVPPIHVAAGKISADARFLYTSKRLYCSVEVTDPAYVPKQIVGDHHAENLIKNPSVEFLLSSPTAKGHHQHTTLTPTDFRLALAPGAKQSIASVNHNRFDCFSKKTDKGYIVQAEIPLEAFQSQSAKCDFGLGSAVRWEMILHGADGTTATWSAKDAAAAANPETWGLVRFTEPVGAARLVGAGAAGTTLALRSNKRLDSATAQNASAVPVSGMPLDKIVIDPDRQTIRLIARSPWKVGESYAITFPGLRAASGQPYEPAKYTVELGLPVIDEFLKEALLSDAKTNIDPHAVQAAFFGETIRPVRGEQWHYASAPTGTFDLNELVGPLSRVAVGAHIYVLADADRTVQLWAGADDGLRIAVNGDAVHNMFKGQLQPDSEKIKVKLKKGWNDLFFTITQVEGPWQFCVRIRDDKGNPPPPGLRYCADSPHQ